MDTNKKGLADQQDGEFILNESGTSVSTDKIEDNTSKIAPATNKNEDKEPESKDQKEQDFTDL